MVGSIYGFTAVWALEEGGAVFYFVKFVTLAVEGVLVEWNFVN